MITRNINYRNPVSSSPLNRGLVGWWLALPQGMGGGRLLDLCNRNHGTLNGSPTWGSAASRPGGFGSLGSASYGDERAELNSPTSLCALTDMTFSAWIKLTAVPTGGQYEHIIAQRNVTDVISWIFNGDASGKQFGSMNYTTTDATSTSAFAPSANVWYHVALTYAESGDRKIYLYWNGVDQGYTGSQVASVGSFVTQHATEGWALANKVGGARGLYGRYDDFQIRNVALSASDVLALYNDSRFGYQQTLNRLPRRVYGTAGGGGGPVIPVFMNQYRQRVA